MERVTEPLPPTAGLLRDDLSRATPGTSAEAALFYGYSAAAPITSIQERPCACGGRVKANPMFPGAGVALHQTTGRHKAWREANDL
jgi:hypothetical protein